MDTQYIKVFSKTIKNEGKEPFTVYYGYRQEIVNNEPVDKLYPSVDKENKPIMVAKSFNVKFGNETLHDVPKTAFPMIIALTDADDFFVRDVKDKDGVIIKDKNGKKMTELVILSMATYTSISKSRDLDALEIE